MFDCVYEGTGTVYAGETWRKWRLGCRFVSAVKDCMFKKKNEQCKLFNKIWILAQYPELWS